MRRWWVQGLPWQVDCVLAFGGVGAMLGDLVIGRWWLAIVALIGAQISAAVGADKRAMEVES